MLDGSGHRSLKKRVGWRRPWESSTKGVDPSSGQNHDLVLTELLDRLGMQVAKKVIPRPWGQFSTTHESNCLTAAHDDLARVGLGSDTCRFRCCSDDWITYGHVIGLLAVQGRPEPYCRRRSCICITNLQNVRKCTQYKGHLVNLNSHRLNFGLLNTEAPIRISIPTCSSMYFTSGVLLCIRVIEFHRSLRAPTNKSTN